jgi:hypothetical protein
MPLNIIVGIKAIEVQKERAFSAHPGVLCELSLSLPLGFDPTFIKSGHVLCDPKFPIH